MKFKKSISLLLTCVMAFSVLSIFGFAFDDTEVSESYINSEVLEIEQLGDVNATNVRLRSSKDLQSTTNIIGLVDYGDTVSVLSASNDQYGTAWYYLKMKNGSWANYYGYIVQLYITLH